MSDPQQARIEAAAEAVAQALRSHVLKIVDDGPTGEQIGCSCGLRFGESLTTGRDHLNQAVAAAVLTTADRVDPLRQPKLNQISSIKIEPGPPKPPQIVGVYARCPNCGMVTR